MSSRLLLDTQVLIWLVSSDDRISRNARRAISRPAASLAVSLVSIWEIVLKHQVGKLRLHFGIGEALGEILYRSPWSILPVVSAHLPVLAALPALHKDPFDRLLVAQAQHEGMTIVTSDEQIARYEIPTIW